MINSGVYLEYTYVQHKEFCEVKDVASFNN